MPLPPEYWNVSSVCVERARVARVERIAQLKSEYGATRVGSLLAVGDSHGITVDLDVLESALAVVDLDVNVERAVEQSGVDAQATRWGRALESLPRFLLRLCFRHCGRSMVCERRIFLWRHGLRIGSSGIT